MVRLMSAFKNLHGPGKLFFHKSSFHPSMKYDTCDNISLGLVQRALSKYPARLLGRIRFFLDLVTLSIFVIS